MLLITFTGLKGQTVCSSSWSQRWYIETDPMRSHWPSTLIWTRRVIRERGGGQQWGEVVKMRRWPDKSSGYGSGHGSVGERQQRESMRRKKRSREERRVYLKMDGVMQAQQKRPLAGSGSEAKTRRQEKTEVAVAPWEFFCSRFVGFSGTRL